MERCNSLKRHRKETKPLSPINILLKNCHSSEAKLVSPLTAILEIFPVFVLISPLFSSVCVSPSSFLFFFFYISQESTVFSTGTAPAFFYE